MRELIAQAEALEWCAGRCAIERDGYQAPRNGWNLKDPVDSGYEGYQRACNELADQYVKRAAALRAQAEPKLCGKCGHPEACKAMGCKEQPAGQGEPVACIEWAAGVTNSIVEVVLKGDGIGLPIGTKLYAHPDPRIAALEGALKRLEMAARFVPIEDNTDANPDAVELRAALREAEAALGKEE